MIRINAHNEMHKATRYNLKSLNAAYNKDFKLQKE